TACFEEASFRVRNPRVREHPRVRLAPSRRAAEFRAHRIDGTLRSQSRRRVFHANERYEPARVRVAMTDDTRLPEQIGFALTTVRSDETLVDETHIAAAECERRERVLQIIKRSIDERSRCPAIGRELIVVLESPAEHETAP